MAEIRLLHKTTPPHLIIEIIPDSFQLFYVIHPVELSVAVNNEYLSIKTSSTQTVRTERYCASCGYEVQENTACSICKYSEKLVGVKLFSISTSQSGREGDYEIILHEAEKLGILSGKLKSQTPELEKTTTTTNQRKKSSKQTISSSDLLNLMESLNFEGKPTTKLSEQELSGLLKGVTLKPHQISALEWMKEAEQGKFAGGILADDMGMVGLLIAIPISLIAPLLG